MALISLSLAVLLIASASAFPNFGQGISAFGSFEVAPSIYTHQEIINKNVTTKITADYGDSVQFECFTVNNPPSAVQWSKLYTGLDSRRFSKPDLLPNGETTYNGNILAFPSVTQKSQGSYVCEVIEGSNRDDQHYTLIVRSKPLITTVSERTIFDSHIELHCISVSTPKATFKWYKNGVLIPNKNHDQMVDGYPWSDSSIPISDFIEILTTNNDYKGSYKCVSENELGTDEHVFEI